LREIIVPAVLFAAAAVYYIISFRSFREKGFLFNNAWLYASEEERRHMDKKPHYRQSAIVFLLLGTVFMLNGLAVIFRAEWLTALAIAAVAAVIAYAVISSIKSCR